MLCFVYKQARRLSRRRFIIEKMFFAWTPRLAASNLHASCFHVPGGDKEAKDARTKIDQLKDKILELNKEFPIMSFYTQETQRARRKRARRGDGGSAGVGAG